MQLQMHIIVEKTPIFFGIEPKCRQSRIKIRRFPRSLLAEIAERGSRIPLPDRVKMNQKNKIDLFMIVRCEHNISLLLLPLATAGFSDFF